MTDADGVTARGNVSISIAGNTPQFLRSVSCATDTFCAAVDYYGGVVQWDGSAWSDRESVTSGRRDAVIACATAGECVVVDTSGATRVLSGGRWSDGPAVTGGINANYLKMVSCPTTTFCMLAAQTSGGRAAIWTFDGTAWSAPHEFTGSQMTSVQCLTTTNCVAAIGSNQAIVRWNGATWSTEQSVPASWVQQVACTPGGRCVAGGTFGDYTLFNGTTWGAATPTGGRPAYPVTCARTGSFCVFAGMESSPNVYTWDGSAAPSAPFAAPDTVFAASCASDRLCMFVSTDGTAHRWDGTSWRSEGVISAA